ncbi:cereblon family protein [uncultured Desulfobulbus sp.]|uniref:cereblon family protein n=1 Tax=uncultured Desulfobulbus sp. TaxID=239745 RepID=UPI0029C6FF44|nr:cereblon family protein [uncultured Desulfobulbus sp.]
MPDPRCCRIHLPSAKASPPPDSQSGRSPEELDDQALLCSTCGAEVTHPGQSITVNGHHNHAFFNPAGIAFEIRCFSQAPGVVSQGDPSPEFTWFPGSSWQIALCATCYTHLGWLFTNGRSFYGLIAAHLI